MLRDVSVAHPDVRDMASMATDLTALHRLTRLRLAFDLRGTGRPTPPQRAELCSALGGWAALRELDLGHMPLCGAVLAALATSPLTCLRAGRLDCPPAAYEAGARSMQHGVAGAAGVAAAAHSQPCMQLPPLLRELCLEEVHYITALAALLPAPSSLERVTLQRRQFALQPWLDDEDGGTNARLFPAATSYVAAEPLSCWPGECCPHRYRWRRSTRSSP